LVANELRGLRRNGIQALKIFLEKEYYKEDEALERDLQPFVGEVLTNTNISAKDNLRPYGMLRRSAIDTIGFMGDEESVGFLADKLNEYRVYEKEAIKKNEIKKANDWRHNQWHLAYALHRSMSEKSARFFSDLVTKEPLGIILKLEGYYHLLKFTGRSSVLRTDSLDIIKKIKSEIILKELQEALEDNFEWSRAHACEVIYRIADCGEELNELIYTRFLSLIKRLASSEENIQIVRHYACYTLGKIGEGEENIHFLLDILADKTAKGWVKFSAIDAIEKICQKHHQQFDDTGLSKLREFVKTGTKEFENIAKPTSEQMAVSVGIKLLGKYGSRSDAEIIRGYFSFERDLLVVGSFKYLVTETFHKLSGK
jgi:hypothetical protein